MTSLENPLLKNVETGEMIEIIRSPFAIGRAVAADYVIEHKIISRNHCSFMKTPDGWTLTDSSTNGTLVNDVIFRGKTSHILNHNDEISLGYVTFTYKFLTKADKAPNLQLERIRCEENNDGPSGYVSGCSTPSSFDENGVSDELLSHLADNILSQVEKNESNLNSGNNFLSSYVNTCANINGLNQADIDVNQLSDIGGIPKYPSESDVIEIHSKINSERISNEVDVPIDNSSLSEKNSSADTVIYNVPDDITSNNTENTRNPIENSNLTSDAAPSTSKLVIDSSKICAGNINATEPLENTKTSKPKSSIDSISEIIELVVKNYTPNKTGNPSSSNNANLNVPTALTSTDVHKGTISNQNTAILEPTSFSFTSPNHANKKIKLAAYSSSVPNQTGPTVQLPSGEVVPLIRNFSTTVSPVLRKLDKNEVQKLLRVAGTITLPLQNKPIIVLDRFSGTSEQNAVASISDINRSTDQSTTTGTSNVVTSDFIADSTSGCSVNEIVESTSVPLPVNEVVIDNSVNNVDCLKIIADNKPVPAGNCHESQEASTSKGPENMEVDKGRPQKEQNQFEEMEDELMCTICANLFIKAVTLGCSHSFCQFCIEAWKKKKSDCPICRNRIASTTRTLVLDNIIEKMMENVPLEDREQRNKAMEERKKIEDEIAGKKQKNNQKSSRGGNTARRGRAGNNWRGNQRNGGRNGPENMHQANNPVPPPGPVITIFDSPSSTESESDESVYDFDDYENDGWYNGIPGRYYGGYGRCYNCGERGHWSNGCPYR